MPRNDPSSNVLNYSADTTPLGHYRLIAGVQLAVAQAVTSDLFAFRWGNATKLCIVERFTMQLVQTAPFTATQPNQINALIARAFTASDTGGTAQNLTGNNQKLRTSMGTSLVTDCRVSTVAAGLTVGTRTLDVQAFDNILFVNTITNDNPNTFRSEGFIPDDSRHPIVLAQNEGIIVQNGSAFPAAGSAFLTVAMEWAEVNAY